MNRSAWIIAEHQEGQLHRGAAELATAARAVGDETVAVVCAGVGSEVAAQVAPFVDRVLLVEDEALAGYTAGGYTHAIVALANAHSPAAILLSHAPLGRDLGPILAARLATGMISDCLALEWEDGLVGTRSVYRRKLVSRERVLAAGPAIATVQRGAFLAASPADAAPVERADGALQGFSARTRLVSIDHAAPSEDDITDAKIVVAGGRGLGDAGQFPLVQELAKAIGGVMAASRPVVDQGWVPHDRQVGSSGRTVRPQLYVAVGVSGAIQHIVGMRESDVIVAINKDAQAPIFEYAHYGIVDDLFKVVPALIEALQAE